MRFLLIILVFLLSACASKTLQGPEKGKAVLLIPKFTENNSLEGWVRKYYVEINKIESDGSVVPYIDNAWIPNNEQPYAVVSDLEPGNYRITELNHAMTARWHTRGIDKGGYPLNLNFSIKAETIHILDFEFILRQSDSGDGVMNTFEISELRPATCGEVLEKLLKDPGIASWDRKAVAQEGPCGVRDMLQKISI